MTSGLEIDISDPCPAWTRALPDVTTVCRRAAVSAFEVARGEGMTPPAMAEASLVLADDEMVAQLNRQYRGKDGATNVLSFAALGGDAPSGKIVDVEGAPVLLGDVPVLLGDVIVAFGVASGEARAEKKNLANHLSHLIVHGMFHLLGYDHQTSADAQQMEGLEIRALADIGVPDPYQAIPL